MTNTAILVASGLLLFAYLLDIAGRRYRLPSVVLLIVSGLVGRQVLDRIDVHLRWVDPIVPIIGTLGLILIVLEGALDLAVTRGRMRLIAVSSAAAVGGFVLTLFPFVLLFHFALGLALPIAALVAIPFAVISSAVAIPSAAGLSDHPREFIVYESALSDIVGVLVFYAWLSADDSLGEFALNLIGGGTGTLVAAVFAALGLYYLINKIEGHVRFLPLIAGLVCLYAIGKESHLSPLVLVLVVGLLFNNPHLLEWNARLKALHTTGYDRTLKEFKGLVAELTFATKSFFFLLLGYWTDVGAMADWRAWALAAVVVATIYATRFALLKALRQQAAERLVWIAPRGLITVLLFLTAAETGTLARFPFGTVMLVVLATATLTALAHRDHERAPSPTAPPTAPRAPGEAPTDAVPAPGEAPTDTAPAPDAIAPAKSPSPTVASAPRP
jgi:hypothetical protein